MSTFQSITRHTTALCLAVFLTACGSQAPVTTSTPGPGTKDDLTKVTAPPARDDDHDDDHDDDKQKVPMQREVRDDELDDRNDKDHDHDDHDHDHDHDHDDKDGDKD